MPKTPEPRCGTTPSVSDPVQTEAGPPTLTATGLQVRLVAVAAMLERERRLADLKRACEALRADAERLVEKVTALMDQEGFSQEVRGPAASPPKA